MSDVPCRRRSLALLPASLAWAALAPLAAQTGPPAWMRTASVYEVNVRQATPEGTFAAFRPRLPRLRAMGVEVLWFMPIQPIGVRNRKGRLGSYYSIRDYRGINPEFGTTDDFRALVADAHRQGFKVILDWVANHTAHDARWVTAHPDWYVRRADGTISNAIGDDGKETDWTDVAELDYARPAMRRQMVADMAWWARTYALDGFRCDMAHLVPRDFWREARAALDRVRPGLFLLAESEDPALHPTFDASYAWAFHHLLNDVGRGRAPAGALLDRLAQDRARFPRSAMRLTFTTNHDENSWAGSEFERLGPNAPAAWVVAATVEGSLPLIYTGQEDANAKRLAFFEKDTVRAGAAPLDDFFRTLLALKRRTPALHNGPWGGAQRPLAHDAGDRVLAFTRALDTSTVAVFVNFGDTTATVHYRGLAAPGRYVDAFTDARESLGPSGTVSVPAHGWRVLSREAGAASPASAAPTPTADAPRVAIISAFEPELALLRAETRVTGTRVVNGRTQWLGTLRGHEVVLTLSGFSMVNAAMTTQALLDRTPVRTIVFSGIAGGVNPSLHVGDVTVPAQWGNYQESVFARETPTGFASVRTTTGFPGFGMMVPQGTSVTVRGGGPDSLERRFWFAADSASLATARAVADRVTLRRCLATTATCLAHAPRVVVGGNGVSGPTFVDNARYREWVWSTFRADALDMETAAVAVVAYENRVPFVAFRSLSDLAGGGEGPNEVPLFLQLAAENAAAVVLAYLEALPPARP